MPQSLLFGHQLLRVDAIRPLGTVDVENTSAAQYVADQDGRRWVGKAYVETGIQSIFAEAISSLLALELGVKAPPAAHFGSLHDDSFMWLSDYVSGSIHWDPAHATFIANPAELGAMLALDVLVLNEDRHARNILLTPDGGAESRLISWAIDFGNAVIAYPSDYAARRREVPSTKNLARGLPLWAVREGAMTAARKAHSISGSPHLGGYVTQAAALVDEPQGAVILQVLRERMEDAETLVSRYLTSIEATK